MQDKRLKGAGNKKSYLFQDQTALSGMDVLVYKTVERESVSVSLLFKFIHVYLWHNVDCCFEYILNLKVLGGI